MFYEEQVIDGVLYSRGSPWGDWTPVPAKRMTAILIELREMLADQRQLNEQLSEHLAKGETDEACDRLMRGESV